MVDLATPALVATDSMVKAPYPAAPSSATAARRITCRERSIRGSIPAWARIGLGSVPDADLAGGCAGQDICETFPYRCDTLTSDSGRQGRRGEGGSMATVSVRYIVHDVDTAIAFYRDNLGFTEVMHPAPAFAMLSLGDLRLVLSAPGGGPGG